MLTSVRTCTLTPSCPEAPPCTQVLPTECKGNHCLGSIHHQDQDYCSTRKKILRMDRRIHLGFPLHLPTDVDHQARIRRMRPIHCPQKMLLSNISFIIILFSTCYSCCLTQISSLCLFKHSKKNKLYVKPINVLLLAK